MNPNPTPPALRVYRASAGSGKTFTLSAEYIKLLIADPHCSRSILAVTFTNKATDEMKTRILSQLYGLWQSLPSSADYLDKIVEDTKISPEVVAQRAGIALSDILHHYSYFRIQTIDTFFQSVLRNLARELDLTANLRIELNDQQVEQHAVDAMIDELKDDDDTLLWILDYIKDNIDEDRNWNVVGAIKKFGLNIFKEFYKSNSQRLNTVIHRPGFFREFNAQLRAIRAHAEKQMADTAAEVLGILDSRGLDLSDFSGGKNGVCNYFVKMAGGLFDDSLLTNTVKAAIETRDPWKWVRKTDKDKAHQAALLELVEGTLIDRLVEAETLRRQAWRDYQSATLTLKNIRQLYLLNSIEKKVRQLNADSNSFLLNDTQGLLHALIKDTDTPFVFEKIGTRIAHIMIDEFQDTSTVQWANFRVLLSECMSHAQGGNLIVGDVKQSIYRWRNGDWRLLNNIEQEFAGTGHTVESKPLGKNYRSMMHVVNFNNAFFQAAAAAEYNNQKKAHVPDAEQLERAYADVEQKLPDDTEPNGYVRVELLPGEDYRVAMLDRIVSTVEELTEQGAKPQDIAIIVRDNDTIQAIADHFMRVRPDLSIVSDEAFKLSKSLAVGIIVGAMQLLADPTDLPTKAYLAKAYQTRVLQREFSLTSREELDSLLPAAFTSQTDTLRATPLYDLAERLFTIFGLESLGGQSAYVHTFFDQIANFILNNTADLDAFLAEWANHTADVSTQADSTGGIRLLTVHKSKGLEFDNVLLPFCDWSVDKGNVVWCSTDEGPYSQLPLIPIDYSVKQMSGTVYEADARNEQLQNCVDNLNLLYVAFTRASKRLFVMGRKGGKSNFRSHLIEQCLPTVQTLLPGSVLRQPDSSDGMLRLDYGDMVLAPQKKKKKKGGVNVFVPKVANLTFPLTSTEREAKFRQSNASREFTLDTGDDATADGLIADAGRQRQYLKTGNILHRLFSLIRTTDDIDRAIRTLEADGTLQECQLSKQQVSDLVHKRVASPGAADWFSGRWRVLNECTILAYDEARGECVEQRPDRVMTDGERVVIVDFKFGTPQPKYIEQVLRYMSLVRGMGHSHVEGYLWFVYTNKIVSIEA